MHTAINRGKYSSQRYFPSTKAGYQVRTSNAHRRDEQNFLKMTPMQFSYPSINTTMPHSSLSPPLPPARRKMHIRERPLVVIHLRRFQVFRLIPTPSLRKSALDMTRCIRPPVLTRFQVNLKARHLPAKVALQKFVMHADEMAKKESWVTLADLQCDASFHVRCVHERGSVDDIECRRVLLNRDPYRC